MYRTFALFPLFAGCIGNSLTPIPEPPATPQDGVIQGRVCDPTGRTWLADAEVYTYLYNRAGEVYDQRVAYSDRDGYWSLEGLPLDTVYDVFVQTGRRVLETHTDVWLGEGAEVVEIEPGECFDPLLIEAAVVTGSYDDFERVLQEMGFETYLSVDGLVDGEVRDFLLDGDLRNYDTLFLNGGMVEEDLLYDSDGVGGEDVPEIRLHLRQFVEGGGTLYASDWAYDAIEQIWPDPMNFVGSDDTPDAAQTGRYQSVRAAVSDASLAEYLETSFLEVDYDLPVWPPVENVDAAVSVHLAGSVDYQLGETNITLPSSPLLVSFSAGEGKVVYSTFRVAQNVSPEILATLQYLLQEL